MTIALGYPASDLITGLDGLIVCKVENYGSANRWSLQLRTVGENKEYPQCYDIDEVQLVVAPTAVRSIMPVQPDQTLNSVVELGEEAEDTVTGFKGIVTSKCTFLNGCVFYRIESKPIKDKPNEVVAQTFPAIRVKRVGKGVVTKDAPRKTGGPVTPSFRMPR